MSRLRHLLGRPLREQPAAIVGLALVVAAGIALAVVSGRGAPDRATPWMPVNPPPGPVISAHGGRPAPTASRAALTRAREVARRFLDGYLPYLYGRAPADRVADVTSSVTTGLRRSRARITPAQRRRHPRVRALTLTAQTVDSVQATATVDDGGVASYRLVFTLRRRHGGWLVSDLADD